jgi:drug/metabolite transporter (DMT)-like permease
MERHIYIGFVLLLIVYGQIILKARSLVLSGGDVSHDRISYLYKMFTDVGVLSGLGAAAAASVFWMLAIERADLGYVYPFVALTFLLVPVASSVFLGESLPPLQLAGLLLIVIGVSLSAYAR